MSDRERIIQGLRADEPRGTLTEHNRAIELLEDDRSLYLAAVKDSTEMMMSASQDRLVAVRLAYRLGVPVPVIAEAAGVSRGRVYQILAT